MTALRALVAKWRAERFAEPTNYVLTVERLADELEPC
jgi:hypothetical protein